MPVWTVNNRYVGFAEKEHAELQQHYLRQDPQQEYSLRGSLRGRACKDGNKQIYAFKDISPQAPVHVLIIPKQRDGLTGISQVRKKIPRLKTVTRTF
jgi:diadenosine tetraphosphate (Ap4A) HIT family hydrolase